jgi:hypothetical protein
MERLARILASIPPDPEIQRQTPATLLEGELARQLAEGQASEWLISMQMADNEPATLLKMQTRALALYRVAAPWFEVSFLEGTSIDGRAAGAAMMLQTTADAFALLSREWTDEERKRLPLPSPRVTEQHMNEIGLPQWAQALGHPLPPTDTNELLEPAPVRVAGPDPNLVAALETALTHQEILNRVYRSRQATAALQITELRRFAVDQLAVAQRLTARIRTQEPSAVAVCVPIVTVARALYTVSHEGAAPGFRPIETQSLMREALAMPDAHGWLQTHRVTVPEWLRDPAEQRRPPTLRKPFSLRRPRR